jgi:hypothetical protein
VQAPSNAAAETLTLSRVHHSKLLSLATLDTLSSLRSLRGLLLPYCGLKTLQHLQPCSVLTGLTALCVRNNILEHLRLLPSFVATKFPAIMTLNGQTLRPKHQAMALHAAQGPAISAKDTGHPALQVSLSEGSWPDTFGTSSDTPSLEVMPTSPSVSVTDCTQPYCAIAALVRKWKAAPLSRVALAIGGMECEDVSGSFQSSARCELSLAATSGPVHAGRRLVGTKPESLEGAGGEVAGTGIEDGFMMPDAKHFQRMTDRVMADAVAAEGRLQELDECWDSVVSQFLDRPTAPGI